MKDENKTKLERIENFVMGAVAAALLLAGLAFSCAASGCAATDALGLTVTRTTEEGTERVLNPAVSEAAAEAGELALSEAKSSGGILGVIATAIAGGIALWRNRKASSNLAQAASLASVIEEIMSRAKAMQDAGTPWAPTKDELKDISQRILAAAGTQADVQELLEKLGFSKSGSAG